MPRLHCLVATVALAAAPLVGQSIPAPRLQLGQPRDSVLRDAQRQGLLLFAARDAGRWSFALADSVPELLLSFLDGRLRTTRITGYGLSALPPLLVPLAGWRAGMDLATGDTMSLQLPTAADTVWRVLAWRGQDSLVTFSSAWGPPARWELRTGRALPPDTAAMNETFGEFAASLRWVPRAELGRTDTTTLTWWDRRDWLVRPVEERDLSGTLALWRGPRAVMPGGAERLWIQFVGPSGRSVDLLLVELRCRTPTPSLALIASGSRFLGQDGSVRFRLWDPVIRASQVATFAPRAREFCEDLELTPPALSR